jgi:hypothetical protein
VSTTVAEQLPPADELAAIRAQLKTLGEREAELRRLMIADPSARTGNAFVVELLEVETRRTDLKELRAMHEDLVEEYTFPQKVVRIELRGLSEDGEIVSLRRKAGK